ncbi:MAG: aminoacyl-tRNA deacylase [Clostridiales bacterium]|nr:aminoacyl-tRNA deacylase [Clostridiales bacterium]
METPAIRILKAKGIPFEVRTIEAVVGDAKEAAELMGIPLDQIYKTLAVRLEPGKPEPYALFLVPGDKELSEKKAAQAAGVKRVELLPLADLTRVTGYVRGGVSPLGTRRPLPVYIHEGALQKEWISISAGRRGVQLWLNPRDLQKATGAQFVDVAR